MINMKYEVWKDVCNSILNINIGTQSNYLQWYPFTKLSKKDKEYIGSMDFFYKFIHNGAIFKNKNTFIFPNHYSQKTNGSFRNTRLVSPWVFLYLECIGYQISQTYVRESNSVRSYYSGDMKNNDFHYKKSYDKFFADINESSKYYRYYNKFDVTNFFDSIDINLLFDSINNKSNIIIDLRDSLIYKRLMQSIGNNKFPIVENSTSLSYLATYVYLDLVDSNLDSSLRNNNNIVDFQIIRYVDDLYIFFNVQENKLDIVSSDIKNLVIHEYRQVKLNLNENKNKSGESKDISETLNAALYDHYINEQDINISGLFDVENIEWFLEELISITPSHNHTKFKKALDKHFTKNDITYSSDEVFRYLVYYNKHLFKDNVVIDKLRKLIQADYKLIKYNTKIFMSMVLSTEDGELIRFLLNRVLTNDEIDAFDISISLNYLLSRNFEHEDLMGKIAQIEPEIIDYVDLYCRKNFLDTLHCVEKNFLINLILKDVYLFNRDLKVWHLYFMFKYHEKNNDILESFAYYKTYFDRMVSLLMHYKKIFSKKGKPNYNRHFQKGNTKKDFKTLNEEYYEENNIGQLIDDLDKLRNENPINHSMAQLIDDNMLNIDVIKKIICKLEVLLDESFK